MSRPLIEPLDALDAVFVHLEDGVNHMHLGSCCVLAGPAPDRAEVEALFEHALDQVPRYRQKLRFVPGGLGPRAWVDDPSFRLGNHLHDRRLRDGDRRELEQLVAQLMSVELDRHRPLWECHVVRGLDGDRWALVSKVHHCMVDGIAGTDLLGTILAAATPTEVRPRPSRREPTSAEMAIDALARLSRRPVEAARFTGRTVRHPRQAISGVRRLAEGAGSLVPRLLPIGRRATVDGPIGAQRSWATSSVSIDDIRRVRRRHGGTLNDVVLAAVTGAHRALLISRGVEPEHVVLRTLIPVSVRSSTDHRPNNQVTAIVADLPVGVGSPGERLSAVHRQMEDLKQAHQTDVTSAVLQLAGCAPPVLVGATLRAATTLFQHTSRHGVQTVTTNVPGPREPLSALGRELLEYLPYVPIYAGMRIGVAALSYVDRVAFGVTADAASVPEVALIADAIAAEVDALLA